jgi:sec-independent protein translocase protein TatB
MFDIAWSEMIVIGAVALIAIGPKDLPKALRAVGAMTAKARRMASEFQDHFREAMREAELESVKEEVANINRDLTAATSGLEGELNSIGSQMPSPPPPPLQLSGEATELDIPGLPPLAEKSPESSPPSNPEITAAEPAVPPALPVGTSEPNPIVSLSAEAQPGSVIVTETATAPRKPARKKRAPPKAKADIEASEADLLSGVRTADANGAEPNASGTDGEIADLSGKSAKPRSPRKRAAKDLTAKDLSAKDLPGEDLSSGDDKAA